MTTRPSGRVAREPADLSSVTRRKSKSTHRRPGTGSAWSRTQRRRRGRANSRHVDRRAGTAPDLRWLRIAQMPAPLLALVAKPSSIGTNQSWPVIGGGAAVGGSRAEAVPDLTFMMSRCCGVDPGGPARRRQQRRPPLASAPTANSSAPRGTPSLRTTKASGEAACAAATSACDREATPGQARAQSRPAGPDRARVICFQHSVGPRGGHGTRAPRRAPGDISRCGHQHGPSGQLADRI